jgi:ABC-type glycerol-3-phosphate transport system substrate-binding protein
VTDRRAVGSVSWAPYSVGIRALYYRTDVLRELGLPNEPVVETCGEASRC